MIVFKKDVITLASQQFTIKELSASGMHKVQQSIKESGDDSGNIETLAVIAKNGCEEFSKMSTDQIMDSLNLEVLGELSEAIMNLAIVEDESAKK